MRRSPYCCPRATRPAGRTYRTLKELAWWGQRAHCLGLVARTTVGSVAARSQHGRRTRERSGRGRSGDHENKVLPVKKAARRSADEEGRGERVEARPKKGRALA